MVKRWEAAEFNMILDETGGGEWVAYSDYLLLREALKEALLAWDIWNKDQLEGPGGGWIGDGGKANARIKELRKQFLEES